MLSAAGSCAAVARKRLFLAHGVLWASITIAGAVLAKKSGGAASSAFEWMLLLVLIPGWIGSERILRRALRVGAGRGA
ncbi:MAG TPA: hypothetical protein VFL12_10785 [Thermoanaerobaculia bacterium]|nr:hypothetical protein [Thermoanaerobaculia bacterium]